MDLETNNHHQSVAKHDRAEPNHKSIALKRIKQQVENHPLWSNRLLKACELGHLTKDDFKSLFEQYFI